MRRFRAFVGLMPFVVGIVLFTSHSDGLGIPNSAKYAADCEGNIFWETSAHERVLELLIEGESLGNISLILPVLYDTPLKSLVRINEYYVGTKCVLKNKGDKEVGIEADVFITYEKKPGSGKRSLGTIQIRDRVLVPGVSQRFFGLPTTLVQPKENLTDEFLATLKWHNHLTATIREPLKPPAFVPLKSSN